MYKRILLAYDGSESGQKALLDCREVASWTKSELFLVAVMPPPAAFIGGEGGIYDADREKEEEQAFREILAEGLKRLDGNGPFTQGRGARGRRHHRDRGSREEGGRGPDRRGPQAPRGLGEALVARVDFEIAHRARPVQRARRHHRSEVALR